jgi:chromate transporter
MSAVRTLLDLALVYAQLSLLAFGGANAVIPEMQRQVVEVHHWMTARDFAAMFALAQAAPGPNMMVVSLVGWRVAGLAGALVTTTAIALPSSVLTFVVAGLWFRFRDRPWRKALQAGLQPITAALIMASAVLLLWTAAVNISATLVLVVATLLFLRSKLHPLLILGGAAALGAVGLVG